MSSLIVGLERRARRSSLGTLLVSPRTRWIAATTLVLATVWVLVRLVLLAIGQSPPAFDVELVRMFRSAVDTTLPRGPSWVRSGARDVTALGGPVLLTLAVLASCAYLALRRQLKGIVVLVTATVGGIVLAYGLKGIIGRPRPPFLEHSAHPLASSFPSGHTTMSAIVYLTIAAVLVRLVREPGVRRFMIGTALLLTLLVGASRVYLAAHYPTDVLAGWLIGSVWATLWALVARSLQRTEHLEAAR
ncbi:MAG: phosphatase PAP2 family protein [Deltaproteobacteria bacterium]|jgi:undecaprenyl-diphosphatase